MKKTLSFVFMMMLIYTSLQSSAITITSQPQIIIPLGSEDESCPSDFHLIAYGGGISLWTDCYQIEITSQGQGTYSILFSDQKTQGGYQVIEEFSLSQSELDQLWNTILTQGFFELDGLYTAEDFFTDPDLIISGGSFANLYIQGNAEEHMVETRNLKVPGFDRIISTLNDLTPGDNDLFYNAQTNLPPFTPTPLDGPTDGEFRETHSYSTQALDLDGDQLFYMVDWGDGSQSEWAGPYPSNSPMDLSHRWDGEGNYSIRVKVKDDPDADGDPSDGLESAWSAPLEVSLPKTRFSWFIWQLFINRIAEIFAPFSYLVQSGATGPSISPVNANEAPFPPTEITIDEEACVITIKIRIRIYGGGASQDLANSMQTAVNNKLNQDKDGKSWSVKCKEDCDPRLPGCSVKIEVEIKYAGAIKPESGEGYHDFYVEPRQSNTEGSNQLTGDRFVSYTLAVDLNKQDNIVDWPRPNDKTSSSAQKILHNGGTWGCLHADDTVGTWAHEFLHCMGLGDKYDEEWHDADQDGHRDAGEVNVTPRPGHEDDIMANTTKWLQQWGIDKTLQRAGIECPCSCCPGPQDATPPSNTINTPADGEPVGSTIAVIGFADDGPEGSGVALIDYVLEWDTGSYEGDAFVLDHPVQQTGYEISPINLDFFIDPGDDMTITTMAIDAAGNWGNDSVTVTYTVEEPDTTPPVTEKTVGQPSWEDGYLVTAFTPITLDAYDPEPGSGVDHINYEVWWDSNGDSEVDTMTMTEKVYASTVELSFAGCGVVLGIAELRWFAVDNAGNAEVMHVQEHEVIEYY